jgi:outer membrane protein assembly factor BamD (BamD/ComL family)
MDEKPKQSSFDSLTFLAWFEVNKTRIVIAVIVVATAALLIGLAAWKRDQDEIAAGHALLELQQSRRDAEAGPAPEAYLRIARQYPRSAAGQRAQLLAAQAHFADENYEEAEAQFRRFAEEHDRSPLAPQAFLGIAASLDARRQNTEAIARYQDVITRFPQTAAASQARLSLARIFEAENEPAQSLRLYDELIRADDAWSGEARERRRQLLMDYPELKAPAPSAPGKAAEDAPSLPPDE